MASFVFYDLIFLAAFSLFVIIFLYARRSNLKREGLLYLYRTKVGLRFIEWTSSKFAGILKPMQYLVILSGYTLMIAMIYFLGKFLYLYLTSPIARVIKVPPVIPLIPYLPELFKISFLPPFYFTYWILIIAIVAVAHEFCHGIFARLNNIKIHSTGFGFLGPFLAAFVEQDEKQMQKAKKFPQLSILAAGTFANVIVTILSGLVLWGFIAIAFVPAGVNFNTYTTSVVNVSGVSGTPIELGGLNLTRIELDGKGYYVLPDSLEEAQKSGALIAAFDDAPAINARLPGTIVEFDGVKTRNYDELRNAILSHSPGDSIKIKAIDKKEIREYEIKLGERDGKAYLGIGVSEGERKGILGFFYSISAKIKDPFIYYESAIGDIGVFIYDLLWWLVIINISVALVNMLPLGIFDGGRFFYLTIWGLTGKERLAKKAFAISTWLLLMILILLMVRWLFMAV